MIQHRNLLLTLFLVAPVLAGAAHADDNRAVRDWLNRMNHALSNLDYQGTFVYQHDRQLETIRIVHIVNEDGEHERLTSLNGAPREVVRTQDSVTCILPDDGSVILDRELSTKMFPTMPPSQVGDLERHYRLGLAGTDRVAGLNTRLIRIQPRDEYRYGYRLWLEEDTGMLLKSELLDTDGRPVEQVMFTEITLGDRIPFSALQPQLGDLAVDFGPRPGQASRDATGPAGDTGRAGQESSPDAPQLQWSASGLPPGFHLKSHDWERMNEKAPPAEHLVFTDGLASVSVYVEQGGTSANRPRGGSRMGAISAFAREHEGHNITVVGEVPPVTVRKIATGVHRVSGSVAAND